MLTCLALTVWAAAPQDLEPVRTSITIVERIETETPAAIKVLDKQAVREQPGVNLDDRLRAVPGFSLFRRSSSLVAHPTTQGVSLRGLGSSGASRSLVLWDGIPINDPFGGWVYWTRVPPDELERVEISRGASTSIFGDRAMSGAIALFSRPAEPYRLTAFYEGGNRDTHELGAGFSHLFSKFGVSAQSRAFTTDGYFIVPEQARGSVDRPANVRFVSGDTRLDYLGARDRLFLKLDVLTEERENGTALTRNSTGLGTVAGHYTHNWRSDDVSLLAYHTREQFHSSFSAVTNNRTVERLTFVQSVPSQGTGAAGMWRHAASRWDLLAGADVRHAEGTSTDRLVPAGLRVGGGSQLQHGYFAQFHANAGPAKLFAGARQQVTGEDQTFFSPSAGFTAGRGTLRARGTVYRSFRSPTLNELFREFRVGNAVTQANPRLQPETLFGAEAGFDLVGERARLGLTLYRNELEDLITNVTLSTSPALIVRQRRNAASALTRGVDLDAQAGWRDFRAQAGYLFADSRFSGGPRIPQVPRHHGSLQLSYVREGTLASAGIRSYSAQFEDDRNTFLLPGFASVQLAVRQRLVRNLAAVLAVENLLDREYVVGFSPTPLIGSPRLWRLGLRWDGAVR